MSNADRDETVGNTPAAEVACEQAPKWRIGRKEKSASRASGARYGGEKERKGTCGHSLNAAVM